MLLKTIGVVGAGVMGRGVAQNLAQKDHQVILIDLSSSILSSAKLEIRENIRLQSLFAKGDAVDNTDEFIDRVTFSTDPKLLSEVDFIIENVTEKWEIKKEVYSQLSAICPGKAVFAANTSAISITKIASATNRSNQVIGMHFMNPVPFKKTVEVIRGMQTSDETVETAKRLLVQMGKEAIVVNDSPGFVSNRVLMLMINEAIYLLQEQVAEAEDVDRIFKSCFGHKMGPLETADLIGLDTILYSIEVLYDSFNDSKYRPCPLLKKMVHAGLHGRKNGQGFYKYPMPSKIP
jgi:3-hydroxybutyryl-CoA dehydrogenase